MATAVLTGAGIVGFLVLSQQSTSDPTGGASATSTAEPETVLDTGYTVLVLNGTADAAIGDSVAATLVGAGFPQDQVIPSASSVTDFETTTVFYSSDDQESAARAVADLLGTDSIAQSDQYASADENAKQLTVVIGQDLAND